MGSDNIKTKKNILNKICASEKRENTLFTGMNHVNVVDIVMNTQYTVVTIIFASIHPSCNDVASKFNLILTGESMSLTVRRGGGVISPNSLPWDDPFCSR